MLEGESERRMAISELNAREPGEVVAAGMRHRNELNARELEGVEVEG